MVKLKIKGKNIDNFINKLIKNNIRIIDLEKLKYNEINIIIYLNDISKINRLLTIYDADIKRVYGFYNIIYKLRRNKYFIGSIVLSLIILYVLSNIIFSVKIIYNNKKINNILLKELNNYGIKKYHFINSYKEKETIKNKILNKYRDSIEWLEIERIGTKYLVRLEERKIDINKNINGYRDIIAKKNGIIKYIECENGEIIKDKDMYVNKGDVIISGTIKMNDEIKDIVVSKGKVIAEVWYTVSIKYPYNYKEIIETNKYKDLINIKFLNKDLINKYNNKKDIDKTIIENNYIPIKLVKQRQIKTKVINHKNKNIEEDAIKLIKKKYMNITNTKIISKKYNKDNLELKIFLTVLEDITDYRNI